MKKRTWYILGVTALILLGLCLYFVLPRSGESVSYENLIVNGDFEVLDGAGMPEGWYANSYAGASYTRFSLAEGMSGNGVRIENIGPNDARFVQTVAVAPDALYRIHGYIKADAHGGLGANFSIEGLHAVSQCLYSTEGEWQEISFYGRTGKDQRSVTIYARLGGYSGEATGWAQFDQITMNRVDQLPEGAWATRWYADTEEAAPQLPKESTAAFSLLLFSGLYGLIFYFALSLLKKEKQPLIASEKISLPSRSIAALMLLIGGILRIAIAVLVPGYDVDMGCFTGWGQQFTYTGPADFYQYFETYGGHCDYPPGYILILGLIGYLGKLFGGISHLLVKLPPILADLVLSMLIWKESKKLLSEKAALALMGLYLINPLVLVTGSGWGQADGVLTLLIVLTVLFALRSQWKFALPIYMISVLVKPQALMFGPLGLTAFVWHMVKSWPDKKQRKIALKDGLIGLVAALAAGLIIVLPFSLKRDDLSWLITLYSKTMVQYDYATLNACNVYFLLDQNWVSVETNISGDWLTLLIVYLLSVLPLMAAVMMDSVTLSEKWENKADRLRILLLSGLCLALLLVIVGLALDGALTFSLLGTIMIVYSVLLMGILYLLGNDPRNLPFLGAVLLMMLYCTGSMMHERYLFPCAGLLMLAYILKKDKRILYLAVALSITGFLNVGCVLDRNIRIGGFEAHLNMPAYGLESDMAWLEYLVAGANCLLCGLSIMLASLLTQPHAQLQSLKTEKNHASKPAQSAPRRMAPPHENRPLLRLKKRDYLLMITITAAYALLSFVNLGSMKAPQTSWVSQDPNEQIIIDLGESRQFHMYYYGGIHSYDLDFIVETSQDGQRWETSYQASMPIGNCFKWSVVGEYPASPFPALLTGRYVRINAQHYALTLFETLIRDAETEAPLPIQSITSNNPKGADPAALVDEPDTMEGKPGSWYNSTYFDEIYHARTGYEHLHGMHPYETTHPPLGKVFMSWCIALFGMTPFGWRFAGALAGVLMLPGMYLLGHLLIRKKWGGLGAISLMALDLMHFTQTRIATIDSFVVLFIIWEFYFMLRWFYLDYFKTPFWKTLAPLALSGVCMGLGIASKWTGVYAAFGLAVILFFGMWRRYREILWARQIPLKKQNAAEKIAAESGLFRLSATLLLCFVMFIFVPLLIYYLSYIPYFAPTGGVTVEKVIQAAVGNYFTTGDVGGMLGYHGQTGFGADHPFASPWYMWPIIGKPMWYFSSMLESPGMQSTILAMGNPAVWWTGLIALFGVIALWLQRHINADRTLSLHAEKDDPRYALVLLSFAAQYLPWVLVPRGTYIYHYFPSIPFIILCILLCLDWLEERNEKAARITLYVLLAVSALLFIAFFPYASGVEAPQGWMDAMQWFPRWLWY